MYLTVGENMENEHLLIPEGWTFFAHRSNTARWNENPFNKDIIKTDRLISVVTESDIKYDIEIRGKSRILGYTSGDGEPFEIRCLMCSYSYMKTMSDDNPLKSIIHNEYYFDKNNFGGAGGQRHHSIPKNDELFVITHADYDPEYERESNIIWVIPKRFINQFKEDLQKGNNKMVPLHSKAKVR